MLLLLFALSGDVEAHLSATIEANRTIAVELAYELTLDGAPPANGLELPECSRSLGGGNFEMDSRWLESRTSG